MENRNLDVVNEYGVVIGHIPCYPGETAPHVTFSNDGYRFCCTTFAAANQFNRIYDIDFFDANKVFRHVYVHTTYSSDESAMPFNPGMTVITNHYISMGIVSEDHLQWERHSFSFLSHTQSVELGESSPLFYLGSILPEIAILTYQQ